MTNQQHIAVARVGKLFGEANSGGLSLTLYDTFDYVEEPMNEPLFVEIDSLDVPLWLDKFERRGQRGATAHFADIDTPRRAEELLGKELYIIAQQGDESDEFYMEDLIGFSVEAEGLSGEITDYYDSDINPLFGIDFGQGEQLVPAAEEFILHIDFDKGHIKMQLPEGLLDL